MDINEIRTEIERLEQNETTYENCSKLAVLYSVRDHFKDQKDMLAGYSYGRSEFLMAVAEAPIDGVLDILDEHLGAVQILYPKEYSAVLNKIKKLSL